MGALDIASDGVPQPPTPISVVAIRSNKNPPTPKLSARALQVCALLRSAGHPVSYSFAGNVKRQFAAAPSARSRLCVVLGEDELARDAVVVKRMYDGSQREVPME